MKPVVGFEALRREVDAAAQKLLQRDRALVRSSGIISLSATWAQELTREFKTPIVVIPVCSFATSTGSTIYDHVLAYPVPVVVAGQ